VNFFVVVAVDDELAISLLFRVDGDGNGVVVVVVRDSLSIIIS
jgi:hypothetical protein